MEGKAKKFSISSHNREHKRNPEISC